MATPTSVSATREMPIWLEPVIAVCVAIFTATIGVLAPLLVSPPGSVSLSWLIATITVCVATGLLLPVFVRMRSVILRLQRSAALDRQNRGTLYYVRALCYGMKDRHLDAVRSTVADHPDVRVVSRWLPEPDDHDRERATVLLRGTDVAGDISEMARDLQTTMNDDDIDTGFAVAPNLLWPMALALGYHSVLYPTTKLVEIDDYSDWVLDTNTSTGEPSMALAGPQSCKDGALLKVRLRKDMTLPKAWRGHDSTFILALPEGTELILPKHKAAHAGAGAAMAPDLDPNRVASTIAAGIIEALTRTTGSVVMVATLPKSVAFAIGWRLGQKLDSAAAIDPWPRLVTVQLFPETAGGTIPAPVVTRVMPTQPVLEEMVTATRQLGEPKGHDG